MMEKANHRKMQQHQSKNNKAYIEAIKQFLSTYKIAECQNLSEHDTYFCYYHHQTDKRRNPYHDNSFAYYPDPQSLHESKQQLSDDQEMLSLNQTEVFYHPILYKTQKCPNFYNCPNHIYCPNLHLEDQQAFEYGQFFRFNINTHKIKPCTKRQSHERKTCIYYHNWSDRRRPNFESYSHEICSSPNCKKQNCHFAHNKIQQVYHPTRYKTKFCKSYTNKSLKCEYKEFCGFAHYQAEIKIEMIHLLVRDQQFFLRKYKTVWCPNTLQHDRSSCVYAHNIQDFRRDPFAPPYYESEKCSFWNFQQQLKSIEDSGCKQGMNCNKCHGWMQQRYHPQIFKKNKLVENKEVKSILDQKLTKNMEEKIKQKSKSKTNNISAVVQNRIQQSKGITNQNGAPFFIKKQGNSESSRRSKALTTNIESDDSLKGDDQQKQSDLLEEKKKSTRNKNMFLFPQDMIWGQDEDNQFEKKLNEERARSQNKFDECETVYSHSLKQTVGDSSLLKKLKNNNINGFKIKNLSEKEIEEFKFLGNKEKQLLSQKVRLYQIRRQKNPVIYSLQLAKFFINKNKDYLLQKTKLKKIKEEELMIIKRKNISKLDFLTSDDQEELLNLIDDFKTFKNEKQFRLINEQIVRFVSPSSRQSPN